MRSLDKKAIAFILCTRIMRSDQTVCPIAVWEDDGGRPTSAPSQTIH